MAGPSNSVTISIEVELTHLRDVDSNCCIYRVPENLRRVNEDAYRPFLLSIGPVFANDKKLLPMRQLKLRYLQYFLNRRKDFTVEDYRQIVRGKEHEARKCYVETIEVPKGNDEFVNMLLVDAIFIIELFLRGVDGSFDSNDRIYGKPRMIVEITRDIRLEENQVPFFILKLLYEKAYPSSVATNPTFLNIAYKFLMKTKTNVSDQPVIDADVKHLVDLLRVCHLPSKDRKSEGYKTVKLEFTSSVSKLRERGVKVVPSTTENLLDVEFDNGYLVIPKLQVTDDTESLFRNIMVFEQCHHHDDSYIIDYFAFLNCLINTPEDVEILVRKKILENWLGNNEEVADLFSKLFKEIRMRNDDFYYSDVCRDINVYAKKPWHYWLTVLFTKYLNHPWGIIALIYATIILTLTALQVYTSFKSLKK